LPIKETLLHLESVTDELDAKEVETKKLLDKKVR